MPEVEINLDNGKNLWSNLLQEVKEKSSKTTSLPISLLILGNEGSGKNTLLARLQKLDVKHGVGLEFDYIEIKDESTDENKKLNVWISSGDTYHANLLKYALNENNFGFSCCMITISLSEPWNLLDNLEEWLKILKMHIDRLKLNPKDVHFFKESLIRQFQEYSEPDIDKEKICVGKRRDTDFNYLHPSITEDPDKILMPLEEGIFEKNLGIPIIVVITKTDHIFALEQDFDYNDDKFDFIQMHLRKICLKYGAALCYTSLKDDRNCELLLNYILHRCYGFTMIYPTSVIEKDAIFIPTGWDNNKKIHILSENLSEDIKSQSYNSLITKPLSLVRASAQNRLTEPEVAEDEQVFLIKQQSLIQRMKTTGVSEGNSKSDISRSGSSLTSSTSGRNRKNLSGLPNSTGTTSSTGNQQANEGVLANFFSSLLNKRGVATSSPLPNQQLNISDSYRCDNTDTDNISEIDEFQRDDILSNSPSANINTADLVQLKQKEQSDVNDQDGYKEEINIGNVDSRNSFPSLTGSEIKEEIESTSRLQNVKSNYSDSKSMDDDKESEINKLSINSSKIKENSNFENDSFENFTEETFVIDNFKKVEDTENNVYTDNFGEKPISNNDPLYELNSKMDTDNLNPSENNLDKNKQSLGETEESKLIYSTIQDNEKSGTDTDMIKESIEKNMNENQNFRESDSKFHEKAKPEMEICEKNENLINHENCLDNLINSKSGDSLVTDEFESNEKPKTESETRSFDECRKGNNEEDNCLITHLNTGIENEQDETVNTEHAENCLIENEFSSNAFDSLACLDQKSENMEITENYLKNNEIPDIINNGNEMDNSITNNTPTNIESDCQNNENIEKNNLFIKDIEKKDYIITEDINEEENKNVIFKNENNDISGAEEVDNNRQSEIQDLSLLLEGNINNEVEETLSAGDSQIIDQIDEQLT